MAEQIYALLDQKLLEIARSIGKTDTQGNLWRISAAIFLDTLAAGQTTKIYTNVRYSIVIIGVPTLKLNG